MDKDVNAENVTVEQFGKLTENHPQPTMKISDGQFKMCAVFNNGKTVGRGVFDLSIVGGKSYMLAGYIPTTAGNQTVWKKLETSQILPVDAVDAHYCYPQTIKIPATLGELWRELYGHVQPFDHREENGVSSVQVGDMTYRSSPDRPPWKYTTDFLKLLAQQILGRDWFLEEAQKPIEQQHQITKLYGALYGQLKKAPADQAGEFAFLPCGASNYFFNLAYDLFVLQDAGALNLSVLTRLKNKKGFQGARNEIFVAATCLRAGFKIEYENERDGRTKHAEFVATHCETGAAIVVEAKSRHRPGVLDFEGEGQPVQNPKADVIGLLNDAIAKANEKPITQPYVIFIDLNLPPSQGSVFEKPWFREVKQRVERQLGEATPSKPDAFNMVVFTNHPLHYGGNDEPSPPLEHPVVLFSMHPKHPADRVLLDAIHEAAEKFGNIPPGFPDNP